jgi:hypothetical protein
MPQLRRSQNRHGRPWPVLTALLAASALFALTAWVRAGVRAGLGRSWGGPLAGMPSRSLRLGGPLMGVPSSEASAMQGSTSSQPCALTRPSPRRPDEPRIAVAIATSRRPLLFRRAMLSFRTRCLDCLSRVDTWFAVDDGSTPEELAEMRAAVPGLTWISKPIGARGHPSSLNALLTAVRSFDYVVYIEDDFFFIKDEDLVTKALAVLESDTTIGQVVFNARYALTTTSTETSGLVGGKEIRDRRTGKVTHIMHEYAGPAGSPTWDAFLQRPGNGGRIANVHWPHFSLHSGMWRMDAMRANGAFQPESGFEFAYGLRWMEKGFRTAFLPDVYSVHLGKPVNGAVRNEDLDSMYQGYGLKHTVNATVSAYDLNGAIR